MSVEKIWRGAIGIAIFRQFRVIFHLIELGICDGARPFEVLISGSILSFILRALERLIEEHFEEVRKGRMFVSRREARG